MEFIHLGLPIMSNASISEFLLRANDDMNERMDYMEAKVQEVLDTINTLSYTIDQVKALVESLEGNVSFDIEQAREATYGKYIRG